MRVLLCYLFVVFFSLYAYRRWFVSACAAIVLMAVLAHPDMPKSIGGIQGLNPWNVLIANVVFAWCIERMSAGRLLDWPSGVWRLLVLFIALILVNTFRLLASPGVVAHEQTTGTMISEYIINTVKWVLPGLLLFDGCRDRKSTHMAIASILLLYFLLALQTIRWMPLGMINSGSELSARASKITENEIGYNRVTLSMMLAGASWAVLSSTVLIRSTWGRIGALISAAAIMLGQALTGGRTGYGTWLVLGLVLCTIRWKKFLLLIPVAVVLVFTFVPAVRQRLLFGIANQQGGIDEYEMTSGRNIAWPKVIAGIEKSPILGFGRQAMATTGIRDELWNDFEESFPHPHNAYLEVLLDSGVIGLVIVLSVFATIMRHAFRLLRDNRDPLISAVGGICFSLVLALLFGSFGGQTFYPVEGTVGMWAAIGLMFRLSKQREALDSGEPLFAEDSVDDPAATFSDPQVVEFPP